LLRWMRCSLAHLGDFYPLAHGEIIGFKHSGRGGIPVWCKSVVTTKRNVGLEEKGGSAGEMRALQSHRITVDFRPDPGGIYVPRCEACGAEKRPRKLRKRRT
jgi:hypothetical protein